MNDVVWLSATEQATLLKAREVSSADLVKAYMSRIEKINPLLNAYVTVCREEAVEQARVADHRLASDDTIAPFLGVPISINDLTETAGTRTTYSSRAFANHVPTRDAAVVRRLKDAGFVILGKTNTPEFGGLSVTESILNGACRNPWDQKLTSGGSSGGAAAALAAGLCPIAHGTDGRGSIRTPASCCGVVGLKPARGRVSLAPEFGDQLMGSVTSGPIARTVADAAAMLDVLAGYEVGDPHWASSPASPFAAEVGVDPGRLKIAFTTSSPMGFPMEPDCVAAVSKTVNTLESLGHTVDEAYPDVGPESYDALMRLWQTYPCYHPISDPSLLEPITQLVLERAKTTSSAEYIEAVISLHSMARHVVEFWNSYDVLITATLLKRPVEIGWMFEGTDDPWEQFLRDGLFTQYFTPLANMTGQPGVSLPLHSTASNVPIGVHIVGPPAGEGLLIRLAAQLEAALPWKDRRPDVAA